jgi:hypothetical protein
MITAFGQSRIDSNSYKRIHYLDYAQITQDVFYSLDNDTIYGNGNKFLYIDTIYYAFKFEPYPDELKKRIIKGSFKLYMLNENNDTVFKNIIEGRDSIILSIPISKKNKLLKLLVFEKTSYKKKNQGAFETAFEKIVFLEIKSTIYPREIDRKIIDISTLQNYWIKPYDIIKREQEIFSFPINDLIIKTVPGVN